MESGLKNLVGNLPKGINQSNLSNKNDRRSRAKNDKPHRGQTYDRSDYFPRSRIIQISHESLYWTGLYIYSHKIRLMISKC